MKKKDTIWNWTKSGKSTVSHRGKTSEMRIPTWMIGDLENDPEGFLAQIQDVVGTRTIVAKFLSQAIIELRSHVRPTDDAENPIEIDEESVTISASDWIMKEVKPPRQKDDPVEVLKRLKAAGYTKDQILEMIG